LVLEVPAFSTSERLFVLFRSPRPNETKVIAVVSRVPPLSEVTRNPLSAFTVPCSMPDIIETISSQVSASVERVQAPAATI